MRIARSRWYALCVVFGIVGLLLGQPDPPSLAAGDDPDASAFERELDSLYEACGRERFQSALKQLQSLLDRHEGRPYVLGRRTEIEDLAQRLAFGAAHSAPEASDVLCGNVKLYDPGKGKLRIEYEASQCEDLVQLEGGLLCLPAPVRGPFELEISGHRYPASPDDSPRVVLSEVSEGNPDEYRGLRIVFGTPPIDVGAERQWMPASITYFDRDSQKLLDSRDVISVPLDQSYCLRLKVSSTSVTMLLNGKVSCRGKKPKDLWGYVAFHASHWLELKFSGTVETAWIQDRLDKAVMEQRAAFAATWDAKSVLPEWLYEATPAGPVASGAARPDLPVPVSDEHWYSLEKISQCFEEGSWYAARREVESLREHGGPPAVCSFFLACIDARTGRFREGLAEIERSLADAPRFFESLVLKGQLLQRLGRTAQARSTFEGIVELHPKEPEGYEGLATCLLLDGRPDAAKRVLQQAAQRGATSDLLAQLDGAVVRATRGPTWNRTHEAKSRNYHVVSDIDEQTCRDASRALEESLTAYRVNFRWLPRDTGRPYRVFLFSGRSGFTRYLEELEGVAGPPPSDVAGVYSPMLKQLLIWNLPDRDAMLETIRHEGFHQYLDRLMPNPPVWFNEGMACYHERAERQRGQLVFGQVQDSYVRALAEHGLVPLADFLTWAPPTFYAAGERSYAQAWLLVHMLASGDEADRALLEGVVKELLQAPNEQDLQKHLPAETLVRLDQDLRAHLDRLARD